MLLVMSLYPVVFRLNINGINILLTFPIKLSVLFVPN